MLNPIKFSGTLLLKAPDRDHAQDLQRDLFHCQIAWAGSVPVAASEIGPLGFMVVIPDNVPNALKDFITMGQQSNAKMAHLITDNTCQKAIPEDPAALAPYKIILDQMA